jgi:hypothetical protein
VIPPWVFLPLCGMGRETRPSFRTLFEWKRGFRDCDAANVWRRIFMFLQLEN